MRSPLCPFRPSGALFDVLLASGVVERYASEFLLEHQRDVDDVAEFCRQLV